MNIRRFVRVARVALVGGAVVSCDAPLRAPSEGGIAPRIALVEADSITRASLILPLQSVSARAIGPTPKTIELAQNGGQFTGRITGLAEGSYEVIIEGRAGGQIQYYGRTNATVTRGQQATPGVTFAPAIPTVNDPPLPNTASFSQVVPFTAVNGATGYVIEWSTSPTFAGASSRALGASETSPLITVDGPGTWNVRTRATLPQTTAADIPWSNTRSWTVFEADGGDNAGEASPTVLVPETPAVVTERNITASKAEDWFDVALVAGDSLVAETRAARLTPNASSLDTRITLFRNDGLTEVASDDNGAGTDSRLRTVVTATETYKLRVDGMNNTRGHYEITIEIRRLPLAPSALVATVVSGTQVDLAWQDNSNNETGFVVDRCLGSTCTPTPLDTLPAGTTAFSDNTLTQDNNYRWRVRAVNNVGTSAATAIVSANTFGPAAPTALAATTVSVAQIDLAWSDNASNELGYEVERCAGAACSGFAKIADLPANAVSFSDVTGLVYNETYRYRVRAVNNVIPSPYAAVAEATTIPPATPSGLAATVQSGTRIDLAWTDNASDENGFLIERCTGVGCTSFAQIASVAANAVAYQDDGVTPGNDYVYRIRAFNAVVSNTYSGTATANTRAPLAPTTLTATLVNGNRIDLAWTDASLADAPSTGFTIERCGTADCTNFASIAGVGTTPTSYSDLTVVPGATYRYRVAATGIAGTSAFSNIATTNTILPEAPTGLSVTTISGTQIDLAWTDASTNETAFEIQRCSGVGCADFPTVITVAAGSTSYSDLGVVQGNSYTYRVRAQNLAGYSAFTAEVTANTQLPDAPTALTATTVGPTQVDLAWTNNTTNATQIEVERCTGGGCTDFAQLAAIGPTESTYSDVSATLGNVYEYRVRAVNPVGASAYAGPVQATTLTPAAPTGLFTQVESGTEMRLFWALSTGPNVTAQEILRCTGVGCTDLTVIATVDPADGIHADLGVTPGNDYRYLVRALNAAGTGAPSDTVAANTRTPADPSGLSFDVRTGAVLVTWTDNADNETGFTLERCDLVDCTNVVVSVAIPAADSVAYLDTGLAANTTYFYRVRADNVVGPSNFTATSALTTTVAAAPTGLTATTQSQTEIALAWTDNAGDENGFVIERCTGAGCADFAVIDSVGVDAVSYVDATLSADQSYTYRVSAATLFGRSSPSNEATAETSVPAAPSALTGTLQGPNSIQLDWTDNANNETGFEVAQCAGSGCTSFAVVATVGADVTTFLADTLTFDVQYRFLVRAVNGSGPSAWSDTLSLGTTVPAVPANVLLEVVATDSVRVSWTFDPTNALTQSVEQCSYVGPTPCADGDFVQIDLHDAAVRAWTYGSLVPGTSYRFRLRANNNAGSSAYSEIATITAGAPNVAPTGGTAIATSPSSLRVNWTDQTNNETAFLIFRCTGGACDPLAGTQVGAVARDTTSFLDVGAPTGQLFRYAVVASNGAGQAASTAFDGHTIAPDAPGTLSALTVSSTQISLSWSDGGPYETGYVVERCTGGGCTDFAAIDTVPADFVTYADNGLSANATYRYRVQAINAVAASAYSNIVERATDLPATPTGLTALAMSATRIDLAWTDNATNEDFYIVERCLGLCDAAGSFTEIESALAPNAQAYSDNTASAGLTYSYRVRALNSGGVSPTTNIASATTAAPVAPTGLTVTTLSGTLIRLAWTDNSTNELNYQVERCTSATCPTFSLVRTLPANDTVYVDTVAVDDEYTYRVRAVNNVGPSGYTLEATANTIRPAGASDFTVTTVSATRIDLTWTDNASNEDGYVLERCSGVGCGDFTLLDSLPPDASGYQNDGIATETSFTYRLYAYNIAGASTLSGPLTATTITPAQPTGLSSVLAAPGRIDLSWTDNADNEMQYRVERCIGAGTCATQELMNANGVEVATLPANTSSYADSLLASNTNYFYRIRATNNAGSSPYSDIVNRSTSVPAAPSALTAATILATRVDLAWIDNAGNETGYRVERCIGPDPCTVFATVETLEVNSESFVDSTITAVPNVTYRVVAFNGGGGNVSNTASVSTVVPAAPSDFLAAASGQTQVNLSWTDNAGDEAGFALERCAGPGCASFAALDTLAANATAYADLTATAGNVYRYRIRAFGNGSSDYASIADVATILPNAVTNLVATAISDTRVDLTWTDNTSTDSLWNETGFEIYRCATASCTPSVLHATVGRDTTTFADSPLTPGETYTYHVVAVNLAGSAAPSNESSAATTVPSVPTSLSDSTVSATEVLLSWVDNATTETGYEIERCIGAGCTDFAPVDTAAADASSRVMTGLTGGTVYRFRIRAFNANGSSGYSNIVAAQSDVPTAPTALVGATVSPTQVNISWTDNAENETAFIVERCDGTGCTSWAVIDSLAPNTTSFQDATIAIDTLYRYQVRASNIVGPSAYTAAVDVSTYRPATPAGLVATPISATRVDLSWTDVAVNDTVIVVERCLGASCVGFTDLAALAPSATAFSDTTVTVNNTYNYRLRAENAAGASDPSAAAEAGTFIPSDPSGLTATTASPTEITLNWTDNSNTELGFRIERCEGPGCSTFAALDSVGADVTTFQDVTASPGNEYGYRVIARGGGGNSNPSNVAVANTIPAGDVASATGAPLSATTLQLSWAAASNVLTYQIATVSGADTTLFATTSSAVTDTVLTVTTGLVYDFVVRASNNAGAGAYAGTQVAMTPPPAPVSLTVFPLTTSEVTLAWGDTTSRETGFEVERSFFSSGSFGAYATVSTLGPNVTSDNDVVPVETGRYKYRVRAVNEVGPGAYSNEVDLTLTGPAAPSGLGAAVTAPGKVTLNWTDNSDSEQGFSIERSVGNNLSFAQIATVGPGIQTHVDSSGLTINTSYYYRVRAFNSIGASAYSNENGTTTTVPAAAVAIGSTILSSTSIQVGWNGSSTTDEIGWRVYRCVGSGCTDFTLLDGSLPVDANTYIDSAAAYGTTYRYQARPYSIAGEPVTNPTNQRTLVLPTPSMYYPVPAGRTSIQVTWQGAPFTWETGFEVEQCAGLTCTDFVPLVTLAADDTLTISGGLTANGSWYRYRVRAVADGNAGPWSGAFHSHTPRELTLGDNLVTTTNQEVNAVGNATFYVVSMPAGSPTVELTLGSDPGGSTVNNGSYLLAQRGSPMSQHPGWILGINNDSLCTSFNFTPYDAPSVTCSFTHPNATTDYYLTTYSYEYTNLLLQALPGPTTYTFSNCTQTGRKGPTQGQCDAAYTGGSLAGKVVVADSGFQDFTVPFAGRWAVTATGAAGAASDPLYQGGRGARIYGEFTLSQGQNLRLAVGQMGSGAGSNGNGGGGGGSFVYDLTGATPLLIAGGGGGTRAVVLQNGCDASVTVFGTIASGASETTPCTVKASGAGLGGIVSSVSWGSGGAGFNGNGEDDFGEPLAGGRSWANFLLGGVEWGCGIGEGGFGGGGSGYGCNGGGGGGGYSGGDGGRVAGGGGSLNTGTNTAATVGVGTGHGVIVLRYLGPATP